MLSEIVQRQKDLCPALKDVQGLAALSQLRGDPPEHLLPAAYVVLLDELAGDSGITGGVQQLVQLRFGIVLIVSGLVDDLGTGAVGALTEVRRQERAALLGWAPEGAQEGLSFDRGELMAVTAGTLRWMDIFQTTTIYRS
ncbi:hypothetical protein [Niveispirillum sp. KHB5.9]|uniref:phage tail terminator protein n=1 Tax=Niveispirillum sp. KHB5.9 TaxID=3400269 RepID=UPI003A84FE1E